LAELDPRDRSTVFESLMANTFNTVGVRERVAAGM
jgi:hypothetical protein